MQDQPTPPQPQPTTGQTLLDALASRKLAAVGAAGGLAFFDKFTPAQLFQLFALYLIVQGAVDVSERIAAAIQSRRS